MDTIAKQIMTVSVVYVKPETSLEEGVKILTEHKFSGIPVVNEENIVVGIITETDIVKYSQKIEVIPLISSFGWVSPYKDIEDIALFKRGLELLSRTKVEKIMTRNVITVSEDTPVFDIAQIMNKRNINRVPVVDQKNRLMGIITRADLIKHMLKLKTKPA